MKGFIYKHPTEGVAIFGIGKDVDKEYWFDTEEEAEEYARKHKIKLPPFNSKFKDLGIKDCPDCKGTGLSNKRRPDGGAMQCAACSGNGQMVCKQKD
jgi:DnaJ-class molecular chaperone